MAGPGRIEQSAGVCVEGDAVQMHPADLEAFADRVAQRVALEREAGMQSAVEAAVRAATKENLRSVFLLFGVDIDNPPDVREFRRDLIFARDTRRRCEGIGRGVIQAGLIALVLAAMGALWVGFKIAVHQP